MIKAIIFDFDGTIIDTETAWYKAFKEAYKKHDVELTLQQYSACIGTSLHSFNPYEYLMTDLGLPIDKDAFRTEIHNQHSVLMESERMRPGVQQYLEMAKESDWRIGLASSSKRAWVEKYLDHLNIKDYFECIRTADDVSNVKPHPELYKQTLEYFGITGREAVAIEDSPNGVKAALAADMHCIITPNAITQYLEFTDHPYKVDSLQQLDFQQFLTDAFGPESPSLS